jgi:hypothetical protein
MKKVKKFGRGGDIITGLGAVLVGKALYDKYKEGKGSDKDDYASRVKEYNAKNKPAEDNKPEEAISIAKKEPSAGEKRAAQQSKDPRSLLVPEDADKNALYESDKALVRAGDNKRKPVAKPKLKKDQAGSGGSTSEPAVKDIAPPVSPAVKKAPSAHQNFLSSRGITTPGDPNKKGDTSKGRSANPIQGTIDSADKSVVRTPQQKMAEGAREVERRRQAEKKKKDDEAYMKGALKKGGAVKKYASGGSVSSASKRADGIAIRGKTRA